MRAYLVKDEAAFERLALEKYQEDAERQSMASSLGSGANPLNKNKPNSINNSGGLISYNNSSDESAKGGSASSIYMQVLRRASGAPEVPPLRNRSSDHHKSGGEIPLPPAQITRCLTGESEEEKSPLLIQDPAIIKIKHSPQTPVDLPKAPKPKETTKADVIKFTESSND